MNGNNQKVTSLSEVGQRERRKERETQRVNIKRKAIKQERTEEIGQTLQKKGNQRDQDLSENIDFKSPAKKGGSDARGLPMSRVHMLQKVQKMICFVHSFVLTQTQTIVSLKCTFPQGRGLNEHKRFPWLCGCYLKPLLLSFII